MKTPDDELSIATVGSGRVPEILVFPYAFYAATMKRNFSRDMLLSGDMNGSLLDIAYHYYECKFQLPPLISSAKYLQ